MLITLRSNRGDNLRKEVIALLDDLPDTYGQIARESKELEEARKAYMDFIKLTLLDGVKEEHHQVLPTLAFLMERGNVTTYEWIHGEQPLSVEEPKMDFGKEEQEAEEADVGDRIDFGEDEAGIDFGDDDDDAGGGGGGEIDWGDLDSGDAQVRYCTTVLQGVFIKSENTKLLSQSVVNRYYNVRYYHRVL